MQIFQQILTASINEKTDSINNTAQKMIQELVKSAPDSHKYSFIDGVRYSDKTSGWFLIRASNTLPSISIRIEGYTGDSLGMLKNKVRLLLKEHNLDFKD